MKTSGKANFRGASCWAARRRPGGAAGAARADPARGPPRRCGRRAAAAAARAWRRARASGTAAAPHAAHLGAVGTVDPQRERLRPPGDPARLRRGPRRERRARVGARGRGEGDRGGARREVRRLGLQRPRARARRCAPARASGCGSASRTARGTRTRSTSTASTRVAWTACPGSAPATSSPGKSTTYEFDATPFGLHLYHCHSMPLAEHIAKGLYGAFIIDPKQGRPTADELVMVMNGFDTNFDRSNEVYAVNTVAFAYMHRPVRGEARRAGADLPRERARVRPRSTRSTSTPTSSTTTRPAPASSRATSPTR